MEVGHIYIYVPSNETFDRFNSFFSECRDHATNAASWLGFVLILYQIKDCRGITE